MKKRYANKKHLEWVHSFDCCLKRFDNCLGAIQAHHLLKPWDGFRGMGMKATDRNLIPLCLHHHTELHKRGNEKAFFIEKTKDEDFGKNQAESLWEISPHNED